GEDSLAAQVPADEPAEHVELGPLIYVRRQPQVRVDGFLGHRPLGPVPCWIALALGGGRHVRECAERPQPMCRAGGATTEPTAASPPLRISVDARSEEHTSELQSRVDLVCRLLLEKKNRQ